MTADAVPEVLCMGESMVLVAAPAGETLATAATAEFSVAGAESNVSQYLADLGYDVAWISRVGEDPLGDRVLAAIAGSGVGIGLVTRDPDHPTGVFFKDPDASRSRVYYYRAGSAASHLSPADVDIVDLSGVRAVHISGVTPALSASCAAATARLFERAAARGIVRSFDVNYRPALWAREEAAPRLLALSRQADVCFVGLDEAREIWGTETPAETRELLGPGGQLVVKDSSVGATAFVQDSGVFIPAPRVKVVEPVGAGDAFAAGYLSALLRGQPVEERLAFAHRVAAVALGSVHDHSDASALRPLVKRQAPTP
jgi:2-dehydro-3-deoxygluconokinase